MKTHIFLIDDDIVEMKLFVAALQELGDTFKCTYASNGIHALKILQYLRPEMIFINYDMPVMNGLEFTEEIRKNKAFEYTPVFLYCSDLDPQAREKLLTLGATLCIKKPLSQTRMLSVLKKHFSTTCK